MEARFVARERAEPTSAAVGSLVDGLASRLDQIQQVLAQQPDPQEDFGRISRQVAMLEEKIDTLPQRQGDSSAVVDMVRHLATKVEAVEARLPDVLGLADIVHRLADQVEAALSNSHGAVPPNTEALERQIAAIAARLDRPMTGPAAMPALEKAVGDLFTQIETLKIGNTQAAADAAREAVKAALADLTPENFLAAANEGVAALAGDIQALRDEQGEADRRNQDILSSVHDTLGKIVDRLAMLETDIAETRPAASAFDQMHARTPDLSLAATAPSRFSAQPVETPVYAPSLNAPSLDAPSPAVPAEATTRPEPAPLPPFAEEPPPERATSLVASMRQMLARTAGGPKPDALDREMAQLAPQSRSPSFLDAEHPDLTVPGLLEGEHSDVPIEPGTTHPKSQIGDETDVSLDAPRPSPTDSARSDFLKLARQAMSGTSKAPIGQKDPPLSGRAAKAAKGTRTDRISTLELSGTAKASTARKVVPLLGAAAVVAAAGIGGAMWLRMPAGDARVIETNSSAPTTGAEPIVPDQSLPDAPAPGPQSALPKAADPTARHVDMATAPAPADPAVQAADPMPTASAPAKPMQPQDMANPEAPAKKAGAIEAAPKDSVAKAAPAVDDALASVPTGKGIDPNMFAQWPNGQAPEPTDNADLAKRITAMAETGDVAAQYDLGVRLAEGRGMERDPKSALKWLEKAANKGLAPAQFRIGSMYREGKGITADNAKALDWFKRSAQRGNARAMHNLAVVLAEGVNGAPDYAGAGEWFRKAAEFGIKDSQFNVAILYARGLGLPQDLGEAYKWFDAAALQGDDDAAKKRDEVAAKMDARRLTLAKSEAEAFKAKPLDPVANDVVVPSYGTPAAAGGKPEGDKKG
jgi:localization factor PodJL